MVHIKQIELTNFKSFGGTTRVPLMREFTVISGPNGSGKSNILDALLFCLGISSSKGMRAERLPDLVNNEQSGRRNTVEASVTVIFDLSDVQPTIDEEIEAGVAKTLNPPEAYTEDYTEPDPENGDRLPATPIDPNTDWSVTRRLRVTKTGSYTSTYYINGEPATLTELHDRLNQLRIYPEGYNVVLQGDVTSIISMNPRERREIIDELAGVAAFDRKIGQAKDKLEAVREREEQCRIIERELVSQRDRLAEDRIKAEKYQKLRSEFLEKQQWEIVLRWRRFRQQESQLREQIEEGDRNHTELNEQLKHLVEAIDRSSRQLDELNAKVKAMGEEELLAEQATLNQQELQSQQLERRYVELEAAIAQTTHAITQTEQQVQANRQTLTRILERQHVLESETIAALRAARDAAQQELDCNRQASQALAENAEAWVQEQTQLQRQTEALLHQLEPQRAEQVQLRERVSQLAEKIQEQVQLLAVVAPELAERQAQYEELVRSQAASPLDSLAQQVKAAEQELQIQQQTQTRLLQEQREKQRQLDKLEAQTQAMQEASGSYATQLLIKSGLEGVLGLVAQLGWVEATYQLALETAAGARLGFLVVEDDLVAAAGIRLLKERRAGRATFLPLNKIRPPRISIPNSVIQAPGFVGYAVELIECDRDYDEVFAYVFGGTVVFDNLSNARVMLGQARIVTLDGELLEPSGAMTGGSSRDNQSQLHFGNAETAESAEMVGLRQRLQEIDRILVRCGEAIEEWTQRVKQLTQKLIEAKQQQRETQLKSEQALKEINGLQRQQEQGTAQQEKFSTERETASQRLSVLDAEIPGQEAQLQQLRQQLAESEQSHAHSEWQAMQTQLRALEAALNEREQDLRTAAQELQEAIAQRQRLEEKIQEGDKRVGTERSQQSSQQVQLAEVRSQQQDIEQHIGETRVRLKGLEEKLGEEKQNRDRAEAALREQRLSYQQLEWRVQKLQESQEERRSQLTYVREQLAAQQGELPDPLPDVPEKVNLDALQKELQSLQKRLQAMEPVNMLALEEYEKIQARLEQLTEKLTTLEGERTEVLLRIENFTTLRLKAFGEAFDAVNENFSGIFAQLSQGDGYLQLSDPNDPFSSGLNLVAHPKGKPVQRLASMSGGEKSLTALSFIFALQRYRPSPFYAFDEVDMFLDGANVERLAKMIEHQAQQAQFIVVSLRRPMIESAKRTIGVTQARGAYTQVLGIKLQH
jgi:chromosome segregation protein